MGRNGARWLIASLLCVWPIAAYADDGEVAKLISECSAADLPQASVDSCLERVRVREETDPSPQLQTLEASLEQRETGRPNRTRAAAAPAPASRVVEIAPAPAPGAVTDPESGRDDEESGRDRTSQQPIQQESSAPRSGASLEDEPPVSDEPDVPAGSDPADGDANDPPQA